MSMVQRQPSPDNVLAVVFALKKRLAGHIVSFIVLWRVKDQMIGASGTFMDPSPRQSAEHLGFFQD